MIERVLPDAAAWAEAFDDPPEATLFPAEEALLARAVGKRRLEFATGRHCARQALAQLGVAPAPILPGGGGEPQWPEGTVGSITHCAGYRAAAVAWAADVPALGIDAEPDEPLPDGVLDVIVRPEERRQLGALARAWPRVHWDRVLFSAKEAVYKAWYPRGRRMLEFTAASITIDAAGRLRARLIEPAPDRDGHQPEGFSGAWTTGRGLVVTAMTDVAWTR